jgi:diguanylate cyclase
MPRASRQTEAPQALASEQLAEFVIPLLDLIGDLTGMESSYLTRVDLIRQEQEILIARNRGELNLGAGMTVPWRDTLCRRALESGQPVSDQVSETWPDAEVARTLGLTSLVSLPVNLSDGQLWGTLCSASSDSIRPDAHAMAIMQACTRLIAQQLELFRRMQQAEQSLGRMALVADNEQLAEDASQDALTGLPNRRHLFLKLEQLIHSLDGDNQQLLVAFIDLDGFKKINDQHGHEAGDLFLVSIAQRLRNSLRSDDWVARLGGDEFVVLTVTGSGRTADDIARHLSERIDRAIIGRHDLGSVQLDYPGASIGVVPWQGEDVNQLIKKADAVMYSAKRRRRGHA